MSDETYIKVVEGYLELRVKASEKPRTSASGKSMLLYSKTIDLPDGSRVGINWYKGK